MKREIARREIDDLDFYLQHHTDDYSEESHTAMMMAIDALKSSENLNNVLDKIKAEIEQTTSRYTISRECGSMGQVEWSDRLIKESEVLTIIDKYKAESEET